MGRLAGCLAVLALIIWLYSRVIHVNPTTVALTLLVVVLIVSASWGLSYAVVLAVVATLAFNYFFLPPLGTFTIADTQNWIALFAFLVTAIIASQLAERARREALNATQRRREVEKLYAFSQQLLMTEDVRALLNSLPRHLVSVFGVAAAAVFHAQAGEIYRSDPEAGRIGAEELRAIGARGEPRTDVESGVYYIPLRLGTRVVGSLGLAGAVLSRETLEALGSLAAIAIEHAGAVEKLSKAEAAQESERLRSALLDAVTHEFRTPLTSIKASVTGLLSDAKLDADQRRDLLTVIDEESDRLNHLVGEAAEMAQLEAQQVELHLESRSMAEAVEGALADSRQALLDHPVEVRLPPNLPPVRMDVQRIQEVLAQLLENAGKYSPLHAPIRISAEVKNRHLTTSVADQGPGIDDLEQNLIFDKFYRGRGQRSQVQGTGMGLSIAKAIVEAHGGSLGLTSQVGRGSVFSFTLPLG